MKKFKWVSRALILLLALTGIYFALRIQFIYSEAKLKNEIILSVSENSDEFTDYALAVFSSKIEPGELKGFKVQKDRDDPDILNYAFKGKGFGSGSIYYGVYYIPDDRIDTAFDGKLTGNDDDTWFYHEKDSDNTMYLEKIGGHFYYYKNTY